MLACRTQMNLDCQDVLLMCWLLQSHNSSHRPISRHITRVFLIIGEGVVSADNWLIKVKRKLFKIKCVTIINFTSNWTTKVVKYFINNQTEFFVSFILTFRLLCCLRSDQSIHCQVSLCSLSILLYIFSLLLSSLHTIYQFIFTHKYLTLCPTAATVVQVFLWGLLKSSLVASNLELIFVFFCDVFSVYLYGCPFGFY